MQTNNDYPYKECTSCKTLGDCPYPDVTMDGFATPLPPSGCPKPMEVIRDSFKSKKLKNVKPN